MAKVCSDARDRCRKKEIEKYVDLGFLSRELEREMLYMTWWFELNGQKHFWPDFSSALASLSLSLSEIGDYTNQLTNQFTLISWLLTAALAASQLFSGSGSSETGIFDLITARKPLDRFELCRLPKDEIQEEDHLSPFSLFSSDHHHHHSLWSSFSCVVLLLAFS